MNDSILGTLAAQIDEGEPEAILATEKTPATAATSGGGLPDLVGTLEDKTRTRGSRSGVFWLDTGFGFEIGFADGQKRNPRRWLTTEIVETFGNLDDPLSLPRWLFFHELAVDRVVPGWLLHDPKTKKSLAPTFDLPVKWERRQKALHGVCCGRCGRSLFWRTSEGKEFCAVCYPRRFNDSRDLFSEWFRWSGHPFGCDHWDA